LTKAGERAKGEAERLLDAWGRMKSEAFRDEREVRGRYTIGCHQSVALYSFPGFLRDILLKHPGIEITLRHDLSRRITEEVISFKIDLGIVVNPIPHPELVIKKLCQDAVGFWTHRTPTELQTLKSEHPVLALDPDLTQSQHLLRRAMKAGWKFERMIPSSSLEVIAMLVESGAAVGILPSRVAGRSDKLRPLTKDAPTYTDEICVVYRADFLNSMGGKTIVDAIRSSFRDRTDTRIQGS
jgi:DNA-binding transcriptional LysR family regulator